MFDKILIANRGEIAVRIIQTCREMGISTVAVYSTADADALHVQRADEARCIGPPSPLESYLSYDAVLDAAERSGAQAVHPGYGFLAENAAFARRVQEAGLTWIGPPSEVIALMGDKVAAKKLAGDAGLPLVPGYMGNDQSPERMAQEAEAIGYPVLIKAAAGGGGRGIRTVESAEGLQSALESAMREAHAAFGDRRVFLEKLLVRPRHVEIQVLADQHGNAIYLGERDCSIQRRHQKVVEESPSPAMTPDLREAMGRDALKLVRASGYVNAGTLEFLFGGDSYYFLEMNTRIQVEHPVTEMVTGLDLVRLQLEIAAGERLNMSQLDVELRGHAIEVRVYAEDAANDFVPASGRVEVFEPPLGPGIRNDVGVFTGAEVTPYYDPLLSKLVVHAESRPAAVARLDGALRRFGLLGLTTNLGFLTWVSQQQDFSAGRTDTGFVAEHWKPREKPGAPAVVLVAAALYEASETDTASRGNKGFNPWHQATGWRAGGAGRLFRYGIGEEERTVEVTPAPDGGWRARVDADERLVAVERRGHRLTLREGQTALSFFVSRSDDAVQVGYEGRVYVLGLPRALTLAAHGSRHGKGQATLTAPMPGTVVKVIARPGQHVGAHEPLMVLEAMKMEHVVEAPYEGTVREVLFDKGDLVQAGALLVRLDAS